MLMFIFILIWGVNALAFRVLEPYIFFDSARIQPLIFVAAGFIVMLVFLGIRRYEKTIGVYLIILGLILCSGIIFMSGIVPEEKDVTYNGCYTIMPLNLSKEYLSLIFHCGDTFLFLIAGIEIVLGVCLTIRRKETEDDY